MFHSKIINRFGMQETFLMTN